MRDNVLIDKSIAFAARVIKLHKYLIKTKKETIISKQIVRSGTSIGANINEANYGQSKADFISKYCIERDGRNGILVEVACDVRIHNGGNGQFLTEGLS